MAEWKSIAWCMVPRLLNLTVTTWPWRRWMTGAGTSPPKVQAWYSTPLAMVTFWSSAMTSMVAVLPSPATGGRRASRALAMGSLDASISGDTACAAVAGEADLTLSVLGRPAISSASTTTMPSTATICTPGGSASGAGGGVVALLHSAIFCQRGQRRSIR